MNTRSLSLALLAFGSAGALLVACSDDNTATPGKANDAGKTPDATTTTDAATSGDGGQSLCAKYGGYATVQTVVGQFVGNVVADCRIGPFFTVLSTTAQAHLGDCLTKQVGTLFACPGVAYDTDSKGVACRDMKTTHMGLGISEADFNALIEDLVSTLKTAGVEQGDIDALAPTLLGLKGDIIENTSTTVFTKTSCDGGAADASGD